jgi:hypothetical protein
MLKKSLFLINFVSIIGIIVFGFIDNFSLFFLSTSIAIISYPWVIDKKNNEGTNDKIVETDLDKLNPLLDKFAEKFVLPLVFIGWLYLLNRFVGLPTIELYIQLIWALYCLGFFSILIYEAIKESKDKNKNNIN